MITTAPKIFGIGLSKTGTTSLAHALEILGYKTKDYPGIASYRAGDLSSVDLEVVDAYDALTDTPIPSFYRELDQKYPNSKFILTVRDKEGWLKSCKKQFTEQLAAKQNEAHNQLFMDLYGCVAFDEQNFVKGYERFVNGVLDYFRDRPQDLLVIDVTGGEGWEKLCPFLGKPAPEIPFPKANVTQITWMKVGDIVAIAQRAGQVLLRAYGQRQKAGAVGKILHALRGGDAGALRRASRNAHSVIVDGLKKLNAQIPMLSREGGLIPYSQRVKWNHVWLIDSLDGAEAFSTGNGLFTVNIALIQDGAPMYGVVYAPLSDAVYYGRLGKDAFKAEGTMEPRKLGDGGNPADKVGTAAAQDRHEPAAISRALAICLVAEGQMEPFALDIPTSEWETAAAQLIAVSAGKHVYNCKTNEPLTYNKENVVAECIVVK